MYVCMYVLISLLQDARLMEAVKKFGTKWRHVSEFVGGGMTNFQCSQHYYSKMDPESLEKKPKNRPWTEEEVQYAHRT